MTDLSQCKHWAYKKTLVGREKRPGGRAGGVPHVWMAMAFRFLFSDSSHAAHFKFSNISPRSWAPGYDRAKSSPSKKLKWFLSWNGYKSLQVWRVKKKWGQNDFHSALALSVLIALMAQELMDLFHLGEGIRWDQSQKWWANIYSASSVKSGRKLDFPFLFSFHLWIEWLATCMILSSLHTCVSPLPEKKYSLILIIHHGSC